MAVDGMTLALGVAGCTAVAAGAAAWAFAVAAKDRARRQRIDTFVRRTGASSEPQRDRRADARRKQINNKMKSLQESKRHAKSRIGAVRVHLVRAGVNMTLTQFWGICGLLGLVVSALWTLSGKPPAGTPVVFGVATFLLPQMVLRYIAGKRQKEFTKYFSTAIDVIVRGLKSGLPVQECFRIIGREIPDPCGSEFRTVIDEVNAGLTLEEALNRAHERMPTQELKFFATIIAVQAQTGGNLAEILGNISGVLRGRAALKEKIKALSSEAKMSSIIVGALPFFVGGVLTAVNYDYISLLWTTRYGYMFLGTAACMMSLGIFVMNRMGKLDI